MLNFSFLNLLNKKINTFLAHIFSSTCVSFEFIYKSINSNNWEPKNMGPNVFMLLQGQFYTNKVKLAKDYSFSPKCIWILVHPPCQDYKEDFVFYLTFLKTKASSFLTLVITSLPMRWGFFLSEVVSQIKISLNYINDFVRFCWQQILFHDMEFFFPERIFVTT